MRAPPLATPITDADRAWRPKGPRKEDALRGAIPSSSRAMTPPPTPAHFFRSQPGRERYISAMAASSSESCNCSKLKCQAVLGILVPFLAVCAVAAIVLLTNQ